jgi:hypothetical protein
MLSITAVSIAIFVNTQAVAADAAAPSTVSKRQMFLQSVNCMKKRMSVDKELSYNAAEKVCKLQVNGQSNNPGSVTRVASDSPAKP